MSLISKNIFLLFLFLSMNGLSAQDAFEKADSIAAHSEGPYETVEELARQLTSSLDSESEKARVLFMWLAHHVRYDCRKFHNPERPRIRAESREALEEEIRKYREKQVQRTLERKKGICEDYSRLYKALCDEAGLEAVVITGNARDFYKPYRRAHDNPHAWNAVKVDGQWQLLDATWAAGYTDPGVTKFSRRVSPGYFSTPPAWFAQNHFPDEEKWQLLDTPLSSKDFSDQPLINYGQPNYPILDFSPHVVEATVQKKQKQIWLVFEKKPDHLVVATRKGKPVKFQAEEQGNKVWFTFPESSGRKVVVYGGSSPRRMEWLAMYDL